MFAWLPQVEDLESRSLLVAAPFRGSLTRKNYPDLHVQDLSQGAARHFGRGSTTDGQLLTLLRNCGRVYDKAGLDVRLIQLMVSSTCSLALRQHVRKQVRNRCLNGRELFTTLVLPTILKQPRRRCMIYASAARESLPRLLATA